MSIIRPDDGNVSQRNTAWAVKCGLLPDKRIRQWEMSQGYDRVAEITVTYIVDEADLDRFTSGSGGNNGTVHGEKA